MPALGAGRGGADATTLRAVSLTKEQIEGELERLGPFHHGVDLPHGLTTQPEGSVRRGPEERMSDVLTLGWPALLERCGGSLEGKRVLDVGCNCGGFSFQAAADGAEHVLGVDVADRYIEQANFIKDALGAERVEFRKLGIDELDREDVGTFDITLCLGLLYHLENPVGSMRKLAGITRDLILLDTSVHVRRADRPFWLMNVAERFDDETHAARSALWRTEDAVQFLPTPAAAEELLGFLGFSDVARLTPHDGMPKRYQRGARVTYIAAR